MLNNLLSISLLSLNILILLLLVYYVNRTSARLGKLEDLFASAERNQGRLESLVKDEMARNREESGQTARLSREETAKVINLFNNSVLSQMAEIAGLQKNQLDTFSSQLSALTATNEQKLDRMRQTVEERLRLLQEDNSRKLEQMRATVDEKLHASLERRLGESFKMVSERLELVHKGLGEMQTLASGVGDLKKVLTNVKTRGTWGEIQLGSLLEQILAPEQYDKNVATRKGSSERVEYAVKLPGRDGEGRVVWLPIDAKFPLEDYQKITDALEQASQQAAEEARKLLETRIKSEAKNIREKYIDPPHTTDFGIMFLPVEGLYAEVLRRPGLCEILQRDYRVILTGPTTLAALLNSLQMGFRTLAIERRSSEVWVLLGAVKTDFIKFSDLLDKTRKKLQEASNTIETAASKTRAIQKKLIKVQELPAEGEMVLPEQVPCN
ncbi:MAG: recombinase RmuC [Peptococcaceae bacterium BRH_c4b]|nr:MAG: recombinase RmuC [Peptococcaceae bacterium BRH_c4b]